MTDPALAAASAERADRAPIAQQSRTRTARQQRVIVEAARRLVAERGGEFTTQELAKEAGVALQTFYRYFGGKDQLLLAVLEDVIAEAAVGLEQAAAELADPVARLHSYVTGMLRGVGGGPDGSREAQFVTAEHWRLHQLFPVEINRATQPITDLIERELRAAEAAGSLQPVDAAEDAWFVMRLVMSVFHHYAYVVSDEHAGNVAERLWSFCLAAFGGPRPGPGAGGRPVPA